MRLIELLEYTTYDSLVNKLQSVYILMDRGATEGERNSAKMAYDRTISTIEREFGADAAQKAEATVKSVGQSGSRTGSSRSYRKPEPEPKPEPKQQSSNTGTSYTFTYTDPDTNWTFHILRYTDSSAGTRGSDKVWGYATWAGHGNSLSGYNTFSFWGGYGKTLQSKPLSSPYEAHSLFKKKEAKGYRRVDLSRNLTDYSFIFNQFKTI